MVESAFCILTAQFRIYKRVVNMTPSNFTKIILATVVLHNFLSKKLKTKMRVAAEKKRLDDIKDAGLEKAKLKANNLHKWRRDGRPVWSHLLC